jgi:hypothetical protein
LHRAENGLILKIDHPNFDVDEPSEMVYQEEYENEVECFADFLREIEEEFGPSTSRHSPKRIYIRVEPGDKFEDSADLVLQNPKPNASRQEAEAKLLINIQTALPDLKALLLECSSHWGYEDPVYRYYHGSFKVYHLQEQTRRIIDSLESLAPDTPNTCELFKEIAASGADSRRFAMEHNANWSFHTRPILEAFFHARYFLEMAVKYGGELDTPPDVLPSGWAALLCFYSLR